MTGIEGRKVGTGKNTSQRTIVVRIELAKCYNLERVNAGESKGSDHCELH